MIQIPAKFIGFNERSYLAKDGKMKLIREMDVILEGGLCKFGFGNFSPEFNMLDKFAIGEEVVLHCTIQPNSFDKNRPQIILQKVTI